MLERVLQLVLVLLFYLVLVTDHYNLGVGRVKTGDERRDFAERHPASS